MQGSHISVTKTAATFRKTDGSIVGLEKPLGYREESCPHCSTVLSITVTGDNDFRKDFPPGGIKVKTNSFESAAVQDVLAKHFFLAKTRLLEKASQATDKAIKK